MEDVESFLSLRGEMEESIRWDDPPPAGRRLQVLLDDGDATHGGPSVRAPVLREDGNDFGWEDIDEGPPESDASWAPFMPKDHVDTGKTLSSFGGKKLTREQREKLRDKEQLQNARESIRKRGWSEGETKWRSWLARRGHDVQVNDWNLRAPRPQLAHSRPSFDRAQLLLCHLSLARLTRGRSVHRRRLHPAVARPVLAQREREPSARLRGR